MHKIFALKSHYQKIKELYNRYERLLMPLTLVVGFITDYITFTSINISTSLNLLFIYWLLAALVIIFIHFYDAGRITGKVRYLRLFAPLLIQFVFGGLLGGSFIFYWFSGSLWVSWPFIAAFVALMVSNDLLKHHFLKPVVQLSVYFFITLSLLGLALPFYLRSLSPWLFVLAGALSVAVAFLLAWLLSKAGDHVKQQRLPLAASVLGILLVMNVMYFADIIPPIPLAVRETKAYHRVQRAGGSYVLLGEPESFWQKMLPGQTIHIRPGERVYAYTAIFAPLELNTRIVHRWQHYDEGSKEWVDKSRLSFNLIGGRQEGFRGYSWKSAVEPGDWRVYVETERGQALGRLQFTVEHAQGPLQLQEVVR